MLLDLHIRNIAIIDELTISFSRGLNCLTGETGAGKSIIIDAIKMLLGDRSSTHVIRTGEDEAEIEGLFDISGNQVIKERLQGMGYRSEENLLLRRVISREGRNRVYINGQLSTLSLLRSVGEVFIDIYGQHEHQSLLKPHTHIDLLDGYGGLHTLRDRMAGVFRELTSTRQELADLRTRQMESSRRRDFLEFQIEEIESAGLRDGEEDELLRERDILRNAERIINLTNEGYESIYAGEGSILERLQGYILELKKISHLDERLNRCVSALEEVSYQLEETSMELNRYAGGVDLDPQRLDEIEERLAFIGSLKRKYGNSIGEILAYKEGIKKEKDGLDRGSERLEFLEKRVDELGREALEIASQLSERRRGAGEDLKKEIVKELASLGMERSRFEVDIREASMNEKGSDRVDFLISPNPGEEMKPLSKIASGGELSRIMLAIKLVSRSGDVPSLIFDEVDAGIGGGIADSVGKRLKILSSKHQVFCVTHLPQIASYADSHYRVYKTVRDGRTVTIVDRLEGEERVEELSRMLGGERITEKTKEHARELLGLG